MNRLIASLAAAVSLVPGAQALSPLGADAASFDQLLENAYLHRDVAFVEAAVTDDVTFAADPDPNAKAWTKRELVNAVRFFDGIARNVDSVHVEIRGEGVLETRGRIQVRTLRAEGPEYQLYYSRIYRRGPDGWRLASHQTLVRLNRAVDAPLPPRAVVYGEAGVTPPGVLRPADGVSLPQLLREVKPRYTGEAMRAQIEGAVLLGVVVNTDGTVGDVFVVRSLDRAHGLDEQAVEAARRWQFMPGLRNGEPVPVLITMSMTFTLRK